MSFTVKPQLYNFIRCTWQELTKVCIATVLCQWFPCIKPSSFGYGYSMCLCYESCMVLLMDFTELGLKKLVMNKFSYVMCTKMKNTGARSGNCPSPLLHSFFQPTPLRRNGRMRINHIKQENTQKRRKGRRFCGKMPLKWMRKETRCNKLKIHDSKREDKRGKLISLVDMGK